MPEQIDNPYSPPAAELGSVEMAVFQSYELAGPGRRFLGRLIDSFLNVPFYVLANKVLLIKGIPLIVGSAMLPAGISFILVLAIQLNFLVKHGQSIGKMVMRTRIVTMDNRQASVIAVIWIRYVFFTLLCYIPLMRVWVSIADHVTILAENRRCLHDYLAGTKVVDLRRPI